jgi:hypothetical protein
VGNPRGKRADIVARPREVPARVKVRFPLRDREHVQRTKIAFASSWFILNDFTSRSRVIHISSFSRT